MNKRVRLLVPILILTIIFAACSTSAPPSETQTPAASTAEMQETVSPDAMVDETVAPTFTISGIAESITERTVILSCLDGISRNFDCGIDMIQANRDVLLPGSLVSIEYSGELDETADIQTASVVSLTVKASPETVLKMRAEKIIASMTLEEKVGQLFLAHYPGEDAVTLANTYQPGGFILFGKDFADKMPEDILTAITNCQQSVKIPMLFGVDEEGGTVNRVSKYPQFRAQPFSSPQNIYASGGWDAIVSDTIEKAALLNALGINLNLAPVCDISTDPSDFIYKRSFGADAALTAEYVRTVVEAMFNAHMACTLKHFPGYGNNADTHTGSAYDERPYETFQSNDFLPFEAGIEAGAGAVMVCHNIVACMDDTAPASMSAEVHRILRETLGFEGVVITDDLNMQSVLDYAGEENAAVLAVLAGNDMLITPYFYEQIPAVINAVKDGTLSEAQINASVLRILVWKISLGLIE